MHINRYSKLSIDAIGSRLQQSKSNKISKLKFSSCTQFIPEYALSIERKIHDYLEQNDIYMVDIKAVLQEINDSDCASPLVAEHFRKKQEANDLRMQKVYSQIHSPSSAMLQGRGLGLLSQTPKGFSRCPGFLKNRILKSQNIQNISNHSISSMDNLSQNNQINSSENEDQKENISEGQHHNDKGSIENVKQYQHFSSNNICRLSKKTSLFQQPKSSLKQSIEQRQASLAQKKSAFSNKDFQSLESDEIEDDHVNMEQINQKAESQQQTLDSQVNQSCGSQLKEQNCQTKESSNKMPYFRSQYSIQPSIMIEQLKE